MSEAVAATICSLFPHVSDKPNVSFILRKTSWCLKSERMVLDVVQKSGKHVSPSFVLPFTRKKEPVNEPKLYTWIAK